MKPRPFPAGQAIFAQTIAELRPDRPAPQVEAAFYPYASVNHTVRLRGHRVEVRLSDLLEDAPLPVLQALARILIAKLFRRAVPPDATERYRRFLARPAFRARAYGIRRARGRKFVGQARGRIYDLNHIFDQLNREYFASALPRPQLTWSRCRSRTNLGHYDPAHRVIVISRLFDSRRMPRLLVEYLVFHEMLHLAFARRGGVKSMCHTPAFRREEKRFRHYREAIALLRSL